MRDDIVPPQLSEVVQLLREEVEPNDLWRQRLLHRLTTWAPDTASERRWSVRPWVAIAAGVACMAAGASVTALMMGRFDADTAIALAPSVPRVRFTLVAPAATSVSIVGDFNGWTEGSLPLRRSADGRTWEIEVPIPPGRYAYAFMVDGRLARDPSAPQSSGDDFGTPNSVIMVSGS